MNRLDNIAFIYLAVTLVLCGSVGCATQKAWEETPAADRVALHDLTRTIRLISDTQIHESRGTASRFFSLAGDEFVNVTIRTGQQVIGAGDLLRAAVTPDIKYPLTLHLGDAMDVSCETEWTQFSRVMGGQLGAPGSNSWLLTPGNHDGFLAGNFFPTAGWYTAAYWDNVCNGGRGKKDQKGEHNVYNRMPKGKMLEKYISQLLGVSVTELPAKGIKCVNDGALCIAYEARQDQDSWSSYMVQLVRVPASDSSALPIYALLLDSSDYPTRPYIGIMDIKAGVDAGVSARQSAAALELVRAMPLNAKFFIAAHHPFFRWNVAKWSDPNRDGLGKLLSDSHFLRFFVSAHTHEGGWYQHAFEGRTFYELNLGSLADAPLYYRNLQLQQGSMGAITVRSERIRLTDTSFGIDCRDIPLPTQGYREIDQRSMSDRMHKYPVVVRTVASLGPALWRFLAFWEAKHVELAPQLLAYVDVVQYSMPLDLKFSFWPAGPMSQEKIFADRADLVKHLKHLAVCNDDQHGCSVQRKGQLLNALDDYYWSPALDAAIRDAGHKVRYCMATRIVAETGNNHGSVNQTLERSAIDQRTVPLD
jgi:hypothetical protein